MFLEFLHMGQVAVGGAETSTAGLLEAKVNYEGAACSTWFIYFAAEDCKQGAAFKAAVF